MTDSIKKFKQLFTSQKNTEYLLSLCISKSTHSNTIKQNIPKYTSVLSNEQNLIFDKYFPSIYNEQMSKSGNINLEECIVDLNKLTFESFESYLSNEKNKNIKKLSIIDPSKPLSLSSIYSSKNINTTNSIPTPTVPPPISNLSTSPVPPPTSNLSTSTTSTLPSTNLSTSTISILPTTNLDNLTDALNNTSINMTIAKPSPKKNFSTKFVQTDSDDNNIHSYYQHFYSSDASIQGSGKYTFLYVSQKVKNIGLSSFKLNCNLYNITESNNKFFIHENNHKITITIPIGYYDINTLLNILSIHLNNASINNNIYVVYKDSIKNKICIECKDQNNEPYIFNITFLDNQKHISLKSLLGFEHVEYINNDKYVSENHPIYNLYDDIYLKLYINDNPIVRYTTTKSNFAYYQSFHIDMDSYYGKNYYFINHTPEIFDIPDNITISEISVELWTSHSQLLKHFINFEFVLMCES